MEPDSLPSPGDIAPSDDRPLRLQPLHDRLLIRLLDPVRDVEGAWGKIDLSATHGGQAEFGRVERQGPDVPTSRVWPGCVVMIGKHSGYAIEDEAFMLIRYLDVLCVAEGGKFTERQGSAGAAYRLSEPREVDLLVPDNRLVAANGAAFRDERGRPTPINPAARV